MRINTFHFLSRIFLPAFLLLTVNQLSAQQILRLPDTNWRLWPDTAAVWQNDPIFLPGDADLSQIPVNEPSNGWSSLDNRLGVEVTLPSSVEQHFWGAFGLRSYQNSYGYEESDSEVQSGQYLGVSWWWKTIKIPDSFAGKQVLLRIRGARLRAEVYLNGVLTGYNIITETAFVCDLSNAMKPGEDNLLAIRITNPGGQMDWIDVKLMNWGKYEFHSSHGFGGLDRGLTIEAHDAVYPSDCWVANRPDLKTVEANVQIQNTTKQMVAGTMTFTITSVDGRHTQPSISVPFSAQPGESVVKQSITVENPVLWSLSNPYRYKLNVVISTQTANTNIVESRDVQFGMRWFDVEGVGSNAMLVFNNSRIRLVSAISWGFWGYNGLFPTPELALREVKAAKELGLNCLQFHRNIGKTDVLDIQDSLGLLRYMEPGGGITALGTRYNPGAFGEGKKGYSNLNTTGAGGKPETFAERYMEEKIIRMIRDHRRHPSLVMWVVQNEMSPDLNNPRIYHLLRRMHAEDPGRLIVLKSGVPTICQAWMRPWFDNILVDDSAGWSGWDDQHTVGGPGVWKDNMYLGPDSFTHKATSKTAIMMWGEMLGAAVPDNHAVMVRELDKLNGKSYDYLDHKEILDAYEAFLDRYHFREAFPTTEGLFNEISSKCYDFWGRVIETSKLSEENDFLVISGWETTAIENHSGLVDNLRMFKSDPTLVSSRLKPMHPVIRANTLVCSRGQQVDLDLYLINETGVPHSGSMTLTMKSPSGNTTVVGSYTVPTWEKGRFVYPLALEVNSPVFAESGMYTFELKADKSATISTTERILVPDDKLTGKLPKKVAISGDNALLNNALWTFYKIRAVPYVAGRKYDLIIASHHFSSVEASIVHNVEIANTDDDSLYNTENYGSPNVLRYDFTGIGNGTARVTLRFSESYFSDPEMRVFDVALNGTTVLNDLDIFARTGGKRIAFDTTITLSNVASNLSITFPEAKANNPCINAFKIEMPDTVIAINCGGDKYTDSKGLTWYSYESQTPIIRDILDAVSTGGKLLLLPQNAGATREYARTLKYFDLLNTSGSVGPARQPWMGSWVFVRENPVFKGLPVNCALTSHYQLGATDADGIVLDDDRAEIFAAYSRDHSRRIGAACFTAPIGQGRLTFLGFSSLPAAALGEVNTMHPLIAKILLKNSLIFASK